MIKKNILLFGKFKSNYKFKNINLLNKKLNLKVSNYKNLSLKQNNCNDDLIKIKSKLKKNYNIDDISKPIVINTPFKIKVSEINSKLLIDNSDIIDHYAFFILNFDLAINKKVQKTNIVNGFTTARENKKLHNPNNISNLDCKQMNLKTLQLNCLSNPKNKKTTTLFNKACVIKNTDLCKLEISKSSNLKLNILEIDSTIKTIYDNNKAYYFKLKNHADIVKGNTNTDLSDIKDIKDKLSDPYISNKIIVNNIHNEIDFKIITNLYRDLNQISVEKEKTEKKLNKSKKELLKFKTDLETAYNKLKKKESSLEGRHYINDLNSFENILSKLNILNTDDNNIINNKNNTIINNKNNNKEDSNDD